MSCTKPCTSISASCGMSSTTSLNRYVGTCDGRYAAMLGSRTSYLLPVHDRYETQEEYDAMCR